MKFLSLLVIILSVGLGTIHEYNTFLFLLLLEAKIVVRVFVCDYNTRHWGQNH